MAPWRAANWPADRKQRACWIRKLTVANGDMVGHGEESCAVVVVPAVDSPPMTARQRCISRLHNAVMGGLTVQVAASATTAGGMQEQRPGDKRTSN